MMNEPRVPNSGRPELNPGSGVHQLCDLGGVSAAL